MNSALHRTTGRVRRRSLVTRILFRVFAAMGCGAVLLDETKRVVHLNRRASHVVGASLCLTAQGRLAAADRGADALFQAGLDDALHARQDELAGRDALGIHRAERRPLVVRVVPVEAEARAALDGAALLVILIGPEQGPRPSASLLQQVFGLTPSEARLACRLLCGENLAEVAADTGVSLGTLRSHVKALFAKTQTHRQGDLVALLTRVAMISEEALPP